MSLSSGNSKEVDMVEQSVQEAVGGDKGGEVTGQIMQGLVGLRLLLRVMWEPWGLLSRGGK